MGKRSNKSKHDKSHPAVPSVEPVPLKKVPSLRGTHSLPLHAGAGFMKAPSPRALPRPPLRWTSSKLGLGAAALPMPAPPPAPAVVAEQSLAPAAPAGAPVQLQNFEASVKDLQGNWLFNAIQPQYPALAGKIVGMILDSCSTEEINPLLKDRVAREAMIEEALEVLREAGDPRVASINSGAVTQPLSINVQAAWALPGLDGPSAMRISPRVSANPYSSKNILML